MRLDQYLKNINPQLSRSEIIRDIKNGLVYINGFKKIKPSYLIKENDKVVYEIKEIKSINEIQPDNFRSLDIIYEDKDVLIVNKPAGISVHPSINHPEEKTLVNLILHYYPKIRKVGEDKLRPGIVHRLDKDTSGVLIVAKNNETFFELKKQFSQGLVKKIYLALSVGVFSKKEGLIDLPIGRSSQDPTKKVIVKDIKGIKNIKKSRLAQTKYLVLKQYKEFALLEVHPLTGRTHQIRVHLTAIGHSVVGDKKYGFKNQKKENYSRQFLHAQNIRFSLKEKDYEFSAPLADDLVDILSKLK